MPDAPGLWGPQGERGYCGVPLKDQVKIDQVADLAKARIDEIVFGDWQPGTFGPNKGGVMSNG